VTHALRRLEERGLVQRTLGTEDKRQRFISVTPAGADLTRTLMAEATELEAEALASAGDLRDLAEQLRALTALVEHELTAPEAARAG
jgi:DNA-binding MarR family transcriptional regulator